MEFTSAPPAQRRVWALCLSSHPMSSDIPSSVEPGVTVTATPVGAALAEGAVLLDTSTATAPEQWVGPLLQLLQHEGDMVALKDVATGRYLWANEAYLHWVGREAAQLIGATDLDVLSQADAAALHAADLRALATGVASEDEHRFQRGTRRVEIHSVRQVLEVLPGQPWVLCLWRDVTAVQRDAQQLQQALTQIERQQQAFDQLRRQHDQGLDRPSELFRREHFEEHLRREVALSQREHREFALVLLAVDRIEVLRQQKGEGAVQQVMSTMAHLMRTNTRAMDVLSQLGDAKFAILLSGVGLATAHSRMEHLRRACATHVVVNEGQGFNFEVSIGVASFPHTAGTLAELSTAAIRALGDARQRGGNRVALASIRLGESQQVQVP